VLDEVRAFDASQLPEGDCEANDDTGLRHLADERDDRREANP
jgi:hypothetical protein